MPERESGVKLLALLGLAQRAGQLAVGASAVEKLVRRRKRPLVVVARDAGESQRRGWLGLRPVHGFVTELVRREELAAALGRRNVAIVAVAERGFVAGIDRLGVTTAPGGSAPTTGRRRPTGSAPRGGQPGN